MTHIAGPDRECVSGAPDPLVKCHRLGGREAAADGTAAPAALEAAPDGAEAAAGEAGGAAPAPGTAAEQPEAAAKFKPGVMFKLNS